MIKSSTPIVPRNGIKRIPWFMIPLYPTGVTDMDDISNFLITADTVPKEVNDTKQLNYYEQQLPGGYTSIHKYGSASARKISFKLELADFNDTFGISKKLAQFEMLRRPPIKFSTTVDATIKKESTTDTVATNTTEKGTYDTGSVYRAFAQNPYVYYWNSLHNTIPLPFKVLKCDFVTSKPNRIGRPQYAVVDFELAQIEDHPVSRFEDKIKIFVGVFGLADSAANLVRNFRNKTNTRNVYRNKKISQVSI
jgi:hypothetical protein